MRTRSGSSSSSSSSSPWLNPRCIPFVPFYPIYLPHHHHRHLCPHHRHHHHHHKSFLPPLLLLHPQHFINHTYSLFLACDLWPNLPPSCFPYPLLLMHPFSCPSSSYSGWFRGVDARCSARYSHLSLYSHQMMDESKGKPMAVVRPCGSDKLLDQLKLERLANELLKCVQKDQLVKAKFILKNVTLEDRKKIVSLKFSGDPPLFMACQNGQHHFVNFLLDECAADIEQHGVYMVQEDRSKHQVTPLWCAAVANKLEVVRTLVSHGANVNAPSDTDSTPIRSACYMTNIEIVKFLLEHNADIHKPNVNGGTCLINSVQSVELCRYLIDHGASVNVQDNSGNLALHYAVREGRVATTQLLIEHSSDPFVKNEFGDDSIQTSCIRGYAEILEYLLKKVNPSPLKTIESYELLGTNYVDEKHDLQAGIQAWRKAIQLRYTDALNPLQKALPLKPNPAYLFAREASDLKSLDEIATNPDEVYMQSLLIRERILGTDHKDTTFGLMYRGAVYADTHRYQRCVDLWKYAFKIRHDKLEPLNHESIFTLQALVKLFLEIHQEFQAGFTDEPLQFDDVIQVLQCSVKEVEIGLEFLKVRPCLLHHLEEFDIVLLLQLHQISLLCNVAKTDAQTFHFKKLVHGLQKLQPRSRSGGTLMHLAADYKISHVGDDFYSQFPSAKVLTVLRECGSPMNELDDERNTPLHIYASSLLLNQFIEGTEQGAKEVEVLLAAGAHIDARNSTGKIVHEELREACGINPFPHITLKCLAARTIQSHQLAYEGEVPQSLVPFIQLH